MSVTFPTVSQSLSNIDLITQTRSRMFELQRQLGSGERSETYGGLQLDRTASLSVNAQRKQLQTFQSSIEITNIRVSLLDNNLQRMNDLGRETKGDALGEPYNPNADGFSVGQVATGLRFEEAVAVLNSRIDDRYLFSGRSVQTEPVQSADRILNGFGAQIGLKDYINERQAADLGSGNGRVVTGATATAVSITEDSGVVHPFGFKLVSTSTTITGATVTAPAGTPPSTSVDLGANQPVDGDTVRFTLRMPDDSTTEIVLTASDGTTTGDNTFSIGPNVAATVTSIQTALDAALTREATVELNAASAVAASQSFFAGSNDNPPQRVDGAPATATGLIAGTTANTLIWYQGEDVTNLDVRSLNTTQVDRGLNVRYGASAQEEAISNTMAYMAVFATETFDTSVDTDRDRYSALIERVGGGLDFPPGTQSVSDIQAEIAFASITATSANDRHNTDLAVLEDLRANIQGIDPNAVGVELLALETQLTATFEATALIASLTLADFI